jgi:putative spermidine/putrescine transport system ATP-binding protein
MPKIKLENVTKTYDNGEVIAVDDLSLTIKDGEFVGILGPTGSGKTTTLRIIAGLNSVDSGKVYIDGEDVTDKPPHLRGIGFVFQHYEIFPTMTLLENVMFGPLVQGWNYEKAKEVALNALEMVDMTYKANLRPKGLHAPDLQRTGIARAIATGARLLLMDEPLGALDMKIREESQYELRQLVKKLGLTAIHVTHDQHEAMAIADRVMVMRRGQLQQLGSPKDLYYNPASIFVSNFIGEANYVQGRVISMGPPIKIETRDGSILLTNEKVGEISQGDRVVVVFRKEFPLITPRVRDEPNSMLGTVLTERFLGSINRVEIRLSDDTLVEVIRRGKTRNYLQPDQKVSLLLQSPSICIYPFPKEGLEDATAI